MPPSLRTRLSDGITRLHDPRTPVVLSPARVLDTVVPDPAAA